MKILLIPDKFKGSATAEEVVMALTKGILKAVPNAKIYNVSASDGGEGFLHAIAKQVAVNEIILHVENPLGKPLQAFYLFDETNKTAYVELAEASGLLLLAEEEQNPMETSTYGTGLQIKDAVHRGAKKVVIGLGGSATNDGGIGMAAAFGFVFKDDSGNELKPIGKNLSRIASISQDKVISVSGVEFVAVNDVNNPLFGTHGAAYIYGAQKGATEEIVEALDSGLEQLHKTVVKELEKDNAKVEGAGAAGGAAYGLKTFFNAEFISGVNFVFELAQVSKLIEEEKIDMIITGEGQIDSQTLHGKLVKGVSKLGDTFNVPVLGICGKLALNKAEITALGLQDVIEVSDASKSLDYNLKHGAELIEHTVYEYFS